MSNWDDYLIKLPEIDPRLIEDWRWLAPLPLIPFLITTIGDMFLQHTAGDIFWLDTLEGKLEHVANTYEHFKSEMVKPENFTQWFLPDFIELLRSEIPLEPGNCYSPIVPPIIGGKMELSNFHSYLLVVHFVCQGQIHRQVKDLPPGTLITGVNVVEE